ncbi:hypothetical protein TNCV_36281 [Trichonephila clavipes]|nr:hypothetical protein TNCV_36281 [Trichonephila clavipes]
MDKCVQMLDKNYGALGQTARVCIGVLRTNMTREAERDFCGLPIRRDEERVVDPPLVFKRGFFAEDEGEEPCPGLRKRKNPALDRENGRGEPCLERTERELWLEGT